MRQARGLSLAGGVLLLLLAASPSRAGEVVEYHHLDAIGNVHAVTNAAGQVVERRATTCPSTRSARSAPAPQTLPLVPASLESSRARSATPRRGSTTSVPDTTDQGSVDSQPQTRRTRSRRTWSFRSGGIVTPTLGTTHSGTRTPMGDCSTLSPMSASSPGTSSTWVAAATAARGPPVAMVRPRRRRLGRGDSIRHRHRSGDPGRQQGRACSRIGPCGRALGRSGAGD